MRPAVMTDLRALFGEQLRERVMLAPYTSARIGGPADALISVRDVEQLAGVAQICLEQGVSFTMLGGGANVLISDKGVRGLVILNRAKAFEFRAGPHPSVWAESGAIFSNLAHRAAAKGFAGLEWAIAVPGTVGGAVYGNAGAFAGDTAHSLLRAEILNEDGRAWWPVERLAYDYRTSLLKRAGAGAVVLSAEFALENGSPSEIQTRLDEFGTRRKLSQPPGASLGSMFKNPPGDFAGRLIEAAGLKGTRIGNAEISRVHANFFVNHGETKAADIRSLIELAQKTVKEKFDIQLELEVELVGEWEPS